jgi:hypothetical protein
MRLYFVKYYIRTPVEIQWEVISFVSSFSIPFCSFPLSLLYLHHVIRGQGLIPLFCIADILKEPFRYSSKLHDFEIFKGEIYTTRIFHIVGV